MWGSGKRQRRKEGRSSTVEMVGGITAKVPGTNRIRVKEIEVTSIEGKRYIQQIKRNTGNQYRHNLRLLNYQTSTNRYGNARKT
jgi:hypothetical protein